MAYKVFWLFRGAWVNGPTFLSLEEARRHVSDQFQIRKNSGVTAYEIRDENGNVVDHGI